MDAVSPEWIAIYKLARLGFMAVALVGIAIWLRRRPELEKVAERMLEDES